ncbi:hypothetical protein BESB_020660 [Besnoitia besnoiti]|uniref:Uncharacterized protein n=1 Tax=Besnoitia besnoiti TaxID=94643 RepID=A0A2A9M2B1_BESBE|nr:hypothetical protein BESB_020660 [Besnoitia besnoiti]PFH32125.1 hypothetical protein BESB_020660 [Besnoitia besnoiti]
MAPTAATEARESFSDACVKISSSRKAGLRASQAAKGTADRTVARKDRRQRSVFAEREARVKRENVRPSTRVELRTLERRRRAKSARQESV